MLAACAGGAAIVWALHCRHTVRLASACALQRALRACRTPFAAGLVLAQHAADALGQPASRVSVLVYDSGSAWRGYIVRGDAPLPARSSAVEVLPVPSLQGSSGWSYDARGDSCGTLQRLLVPLQDSGSGGAVGMLVVLLPPEACAQALRRRACSLLASVADEAAAALAPSGGGAAAPALPLPLPQPSPVQPTWEWDVFGALPLERGHWPDLAREEQRQFERALGQGPSSGEPEHAAAVRLGEARLHEAVVEMLCGSRTAALLGPELQLPRAPMECLARRVRALYHGNLFHNYYHAVSVLHAAWLLAGLPAIAARLQPIETLALLLSALGHDLEHPGHSNALERALGTRLSLLHNDSSILERHHASVLSCLLVDTPGLLQGLSPRHRAELRALTLAAVLHTDIAGHQELMGALEGGARGSTLVAALLHAADLGGQAYNSVEVRLNWAARIRGEFRSQAALESALGLPRSPHMQGLEAEGDFAAAQVQFLNAVALPLWQRLHSLLGGLEAPLANLQDTCALFSARAGGENPT